MRLHKDTENFHPCYRNLQGTVDRNMEANKCCTRSSILKFHTKYCGSITGRTLGRGHR